MPNTQIGTLPTTGGDICELIFQSHHVLIVFDRKNTFRTNIQYFCADEFESIPFLTGKTLFAQIMCIFVRTNYYSDDL